MTTPGRSDDPRAIRRAALRKAVVQLVMGVVALDAIALAIYYGMGIRYAPVRTQNTFAIVWTVATAFVVAVLLRRVRAVRSIR